MTGTRSAETSAVPSGAPGPAQPDSVHVPDPDRFSNRELSWLAFNARVLTLAEDQRQPLLERIKFLAIFASNLDEFYMVRIAGLKRRAEMGLQGLSADGLSPTDTRAAFSRTSGRTWPSTESASCGGTPSTTRSGSASAATSAPRFSRCSRRWPSIRL